MARDIAGLLTGISSRQQPVQQAVPGSPNFYGEFMAARGQGLQQGLGRLARGGAPSRQEQIEGSMFQLSDPTTATGEAKDTATRIADLTKLAQVQQMRGNPAGAMQSLAQVQQLQQQIQKETQARASGANRASIAEQLKNINNGQYDTLAKAVINEQGSGRSKALEKALEIIGREPSKVQDPALVKEYKYAITPAGGSFEGDLEDWALLKKAKGPTFNIGDKAEAERLSAKLGIQAEMYEGTRTEQEGARQKITTGQSIIKAVDDNVFTGAFAETLTDFSQGLENIYTISGIAPPVKLQQTVLNAGTIKKAGFDAMLPLIEAQGRGFTDKDREHAKTVLPGLSQSWQYNELAGTLSILEGNTSIEKNKFARKRAMLDDVTDAGGQTLWTQYLEDVPMSKTVDAERNGLKYKKVQPLKDNEDLSQYWVSARPTGFKINMQGEVVSKSMGDIAEAASEYGYGSIREFLADLSRQGLLIDGVY
jgi:hypothetical protein